MTQERSVAQATVLRRVDRVRVDSGGAVLEIGAIPATPLGAMPGWLTGESLVEQGVEVAMPNLPRDIVRPGLTVEPWEVRIAAHGPRTARILIAPAGHRAHGEAPSWLGIVTDDATTPVRVVETDTSVEIHGEQFRVVVGRWPFSVRVRDADGRAVLRTAERLRQVAGLPVAPPVIAENDGLTMNLEFAPDESILGFGEFFGRTEKNGQRLRLRTDDALGTGTGLCYKPVPVWHSTAGYGAFVNTGAELVADVGQTKPSVLSAQVADRALDLFVFVSGDPAERLADYTALTGRSTVPPLWAFGYWMGRCRYHSREEVLGVSARMSEHGIPCDVLHLDPDWLVVDRLNTDFIWNEERFGERSSFVRELADSGRRLSVWEVPYVDPASPRYPELAAQGRLVTTAEGEVAHVEGTPTVDGRPRALIDFTDPGACEWWREQHRLFLDDGVAVFKTDFGEGFPADGTFASGLPAAHLHNLYPLVYNGATSAAIAEHTGRAPLVWGRSGWAGSHRYPGQWGGDAESTIAGMQATLRGGLSYALSAPGFWSHDIGGFYGPELTPGLYVRWTQFGALSPLMRAHGLRPREPWEFGERALEISRTWIRRRYALLPHLWQTANRSAAAGLPMMRPLYLEFPRDPVARTIDSQFMLGESLLVVPVFDDRMDEVNRSFYVPAGEWQDLYTGEHYIGGLFHERRIALHEMPVLVREGSTLPMAELPETVRNTDDLLSAPWTLHVFGTEPETDLIGFDGEPMDAADLAVRRR